MDTFSNSHGTFSRDACDSASYRRNTRYELRVLYDYDFRRPYSLPTTTYSTASPDLPRSPASRALPSTFLIRFIYCSAMDLLYVFRPFPS